MSFQHIAQIIETPPVVIQTPDGDTWSREAFADGYSLVSALTKETLTINKFIKKYYPEIYAARRTYIAPPQFLTHGFSPSIRNRVLARLIYLSDDYGYLDDLSETLLPFYRHLIDFPSAYPTAAAQSFAAFKWACPSEETAASLVTQHRLLNIPSALPPTLAAIVSLSYISDGCILETHQTHTLQDRWDAAEETLYKSFSSTTYEQIRQNPGRHLSETKSAFLSAFYWYEYTYASLPGAVTQTFSAMFAKRYAAHLAALRTGMSPEPPDPFPEIPLMEPLQLTFTLADLSPAAPQSDKAPVQNASAADAAFLAYNFQPSIVYDTRSTGVRADRLRKWESQGYVTILDPTPELLAALPKRRGPKPLLFRVGAGRVGAGRVGAGRKSERLAAPPYLP